MSICVNNTERECAISIMKDETVKVEQAFIAYQGVPGSYSYEAMSEIFGASIPAINVNDFEEVFTLLTEGKVKYGILPIENSSTGDIHEVIDLLNKNDVYIVGEKPLKIDHCLIGVKGTSLEDIREVYSHPQAFQQCSEFFKRQQEWKLIAYYNTAKSVEHVKNKNSKNIAAVASKKAAELYGVQVIKSNINFNCSNYTRFVVIGKEFEDKKENDKISIVISLPHEVGSLNEVIRFIAENGLNMLKIESRPIIGKPWEYYFYIDFGGNLRDEAVKRTVEAIKKNSLYFKLLGNYKSDRN